MPYRNSCSPLPFECRPIQLASGRRKMRAPNTSAVPRRNTNSIQDKCALAICSISFGQPSTHDGLDRSYAEDSAEDNLEFRQQWIWCSKSWRGIRVQLFCVG